MRLKHVFTRVVNRVKKKIKFQSMKIELRNILR